MRTVCAVATVLKTRCRCGHALWAHGGDKSKPCTHHGCVCRAFVRARKGLDLTRKQYAAGFRPLYPTTRRAT